MRGGDALVWRCNGEYWADTTVSRESQAATLTLESGVVEEVQFIGSFSRQMLTFVHNPVRAATRGVVICSPIMVELQVNQRRERELANRLAEQGMAVLRFHFVGEGNSDALDGGITLDTLVDDAAEATTWFTQATNVETLGFVGTRLGGVPAAATAAKLGAPIALWAPITNIDRYFSELSRIRSVARLIAGEASEGARSSMSEMLRQEGAVDVVGYSITKAFVESCHTTTIAGALRGIPVPVLLVALGASPTVYDGLRDELTDAGSAVDVVVIEGNPSWWLQTVDDREVGDVNDKLLISSTVEWMADVLTPSAPVSRKHPSR